LQCDAQSTEQNSLPVTPTTRQQTLWS